MRRWIFRISILFPFILLIFALVPRESAAVQEEVVITGARVAGETAEMSFRLSNPHPPEIIEVIKSGISVNFVYEIVVKRVHSNWFDKKVGGVTVRKEIGFDPISGEYTITVYPGGEKKIFDNILEAANEFFQVKGMNIPLDTPAVPGKTYEFFVRAKMDELEISDVFRFLPFVSGWFEVKTDWSHVKVRALK